jgi:hypothetical protein
MNYIKFEWDENKNILNQMNQNIIKGESKMRNEYDFSQSVR